MELVGATGVAGRATAHVRRALANREVETLDERGVQGLGILRLPQRSLQPTRRADPPAPFDSDDAIVPPSLEHVTIDARRPKEALTHPNVVLEPIGRDQRDSHHASAEDDVVADGRQGYVEAQYNLGRMYANGEGVPEDFVEAVAWYRKAAEQGHVEAIAWYRKAVDQNHADAQFTLGQMYFGGVDNAEASTWYRKAAEQGHVEAQYMLGWMNHRGFMGNASPWDLTAPDFVAAVAWYRKAAEQGYVEAQYNLGRMYANGEGVPQDFVEAVAWYHQAAEQGLPQALWYLGDMYSEGLGVPQDFVEAHRWYNLAASRLTGDQREEAATDRDAVAERMTPADLSEAQRRAREWYAAHPIP